ncbi:peptidase [Streptomyces sp. NPDC059352]|uniref:peptidase n=1 Tax=Streptomyces sp. NPDC059352 TaxID=3346810 RepID=UPI00369ECFD1
MKIRRILATAVAAAVTTPVVFLSAAPAFADTKPSPASTQKPAQDEDDLDDEMPSLEELKAAVAEAQKAYDEAVVELAKAMEKLEAFREADHPLKSAAAAAKTAADEAAAAKTAADEALDEAEKAVTGLPADATEEQKAAAAAAVTAAKTVADEAATAKTAAEQEAKDAEKAFDDARATAARLVELTKKVKEAAAEDLAEAEEELEFFEEFPECKEDNAVEVALSGPETVTAGRPAIFSLRVTNTSDRTLDAVEVYANAAQFPEPDEVIDEETGFEDRLIPVEWSSADVLEWTPVSDEFEAIEVGKLAKGAHYDVKLRLTVAADAPAGKGLAYAYAYGSYENDDESCGIGEEYAKVDFDVLAAKGDKPEPTPTPTPSASTSTPTPAPTVTTGGTTGNTNTTQQGGSSRTPVNGTLAATGSNDVLPQLGLAAGAAVALGAGALVVARRRRAGADA